MDSWIHDGFLGSRLVSGFTMEFLGHDGLLDSRWNSGFAMDFWIHDGFAMAFKHIKRICPSSAKNIPIKPAEAG